MPAINLAGALAAITAQDAAVEAALSAQRATVSECTAIARDALLEYVQTLPRSSADVHHLPIWLANGLASVWAAQYRWVLNLVGWYQLYDFVNGLLKDSGWTVVLAGASQPDPRNKYQMSQTMYIGVRPVGI